jgi:ComEC/Rec2-related protein
VSRIPSRSALLLRQRVPFIGLFVSAVLGILSSDPRPDLWPIWGVASCLTALSLLRLCSSLGVYFSTLLFFAFWHGYQINTDEGFRTSATLTDTDQSVKLSVATEPKTDMYRLTQRFTAVVKSVGDKTTCFPVAAECAGGPYAYGDEIQAEGKFSRLAPPSNPGEFDYAEFLRRENIYLEFRSSRGTPPEAISHDRGNPIVAAALMLRRRIADTLKIGLESDPEVVETIQGMVLGARGETSADLKKLFQETGTIHLFAASGLQVALFGGIALSAIRCVCIRRRFAALLIIPVVTTYCATTGFHPATVRATVMAILLAIGVSMERPTVALNTLAASGLIILGYNTQQLFQVGFQLSFAAVFGIVTMVDFGANILSQPFQLDPFFPRRLLKPWQRFYYKLLFRFCESLSLALVCSIATAPVLILWENHISLVAIFANLLVVPLASMVMVLGVVSTLVMPFLSSLGIDLNNTCWLITKIILFLLHGAVSIPAHSLNVANPGTSSTDGFAVLSEGTSHVCYIRSEGKSWLFNTGTPSQWERVTLPFLRYQGVNQLQGVITTESGRKRSGGPPLRHDDIPVAQFLEPGSDPVQSENVSIPGASGESPKLISIADSHLQAQGSESSQNIILTAKIGQYEVLLLSDVTDQTLNLLRPHHVDVVYCAHTRTKRFPRDALIRIVSPQLIILTGTKPEITAAQANPEKLEPRWLFVKETGAITAFVSGDELIVNGFRGPQIRFRSRSR